MSRRPPPPENVFQFGACAVWYVVAKVVDAVLWVARVKRA